MERPASGSSSTSGSGLCEEKEQSLYKPHDQGVPVATVPNHSL